MVHPDNAPSQKAKIFKEYMKSNSMSMIPYPRSPDIAVLRAYFYMEKLKGGPKGISFEPPDLIAKKTLEILQNPFFKSWEIKIREFDVNCDYGNSCIAYSKLRLYSNIDTEQLSLNILNIAFYNHNVVF